MYPPQLPTDTSEGKVELDLQRDKAKYRQEAQFPSASCGVPCRTGQAKIYVSNLHDLCRDLCYYRV